MENKTKQTKPIDTNRSGYCQRDGMRLVKSVKGIKKYETNKVKGCNIQQFYDYS